MEDRQREQSWEEQAQRFVQWFEGQGGNLGRCEIRQTGGKGFGVFLREDAAVKPAHEEEEVLLMSLPFDLAINVKTITSASCCSSSSSSSSSSSNATSSSSVGSCSSPLAPFFSSLLSEGLLDERQLIMTFLVVEKLRGSFSFWKPYLDMLPSSFSSPLWFSDAELAQLEGTPILSATRGKLRNLRASFSETILPAVASLCCHLPAGEVIREPCFDDYLWADSVFWSRALSVPFPAGYVQSHAATSARDTNPSAEGLREENGVEGARREGTDRNHGSDDIRASEDDDGNDGGDGEEVGRVVLESLLPGIDFINHTSHPRVRWDTSAQYCQPSTSITSSGSGGVPSLPSNSIYVITGPGVELAGGREVTFDYGGKGNEELLFLYGFALRNNPRDSLMLLYPKAMLDDDECADAKWQLLNVQNLPLRWILTREHLQPAEEEEAAVDGAAAEEAELVEAATGEAEGAPAGRKPEPGKSSERIPEMEKKALCSQSQTSCCDGDDGTMGRADLAVGALTEGVRDISLGGRVEKDVAGLDGVRESRSEVKGTAGTATQLRREAESSLLDASELDGNREASCGECIHDTGRDGGELHSGGTDGSSKRGDGSSKSRECRLPLEMMAALRVLSLDNDAVRRCAKMLQEIKEKRGDKDLTCEDAALAVKASSGGDQKALTLLRRILLVRQGDLEQASGFESDDERIMEKLTSIDKRNDEGVQDESINRKLAAVLYRHGQKRLVRSFLTKVEERLDAW